jgi:hypothetical protein
MERKVATLEVYVSDRDNGESSHLDTHGGDKGRYKIVLNPNFYGQVDWLEKNHPWHSFAHELGHFLAELAKRPSHDIFNMFYHGRVPTEMEAWRIAHEILPPPVMENPSPVEEAAMGQYKESEGK